MTDNPLFDDANIIYAYTRANAIEDGVLVDVTEIARDYGFSIPVAITASIHAQLEVTEYDEKYGQSYRGRLGDLLTAAAFWARSCGPKISELDFVIRVENHFPDQIEYGYINAHMTAGPGDKGELVITIGEIDDF